MQLEYDNIEGMILLSELSRRRIRSIQKLIRVGRNEVVVVLRVDKEKGATLIPDLPAYRTADEGIVMHTRPGYIDLSKRRVSPEDIVKCEERYMKSKTVASILRHVATKLPSISSDDPASLESAAADVPAAEPAPTPAPDATPALANDPAPDPDVKETKRARRQRAHAQEEEAAAAAGTAAGEDAAAGEESRLEALYETIAWPLHKTYGHPYDAFKRALTCVPPIISPTWILMMGWTTRRESDTVFGALTATPQPGALPLLQATIARRLTPQPIKLRADIELTCFTPAGIDALKRALRAGEAASSEAVPIRAKLVAPPLYVLTTNATDKVGRPQLFGVCVMLTVRLVRGGGPA